MIKTAPPHSTFFHIKRFLLRNIISELIIHRTFRRNQCRPSPETISKEISVAVAQDLHGGGASEFAFG